MEGNTQLDKEKLNKVTGGNGQPTLYSYKCSDCGYTWETNRKIEKNNKCGKCGSKNVKQS